MATEPTALVSTIVDFIRSQSAIEHMVVGGSEHFGTIDVLVNNAG